MGILDFNVIGQISGLIIAIGLAAVFGYLLWKHRDESTPEVKSDRRIYGVVFLVLLLLVAVDVWPGAAPPGSTTGAHQLAGILTISTTAGASCYAFVPAAGFTLHCDSVSGSYNMVTTNNGTGTPQSGLSAGVNLLTKYSTNLMYVAGTTTAANEFGITFTVRRTDSDFQDSACAGPCKAAVSFSISGPAGWNQNSNVSGVQPISILAQDANTNFMEGWTDTGSNTVVGQENAGALMSLTGGGNSASVKFAAVFNQASMPRYLVEKTYSYTAQITVTMAFNALPDGTSAQSVTWTIPLTVTYTNAAA